jgi:hypothetical protein
LDITGQYNLYNYYEFCHFHLRDNLGALKITHTFFSYYTGANGKVPPNRHHAMNITVCEVPGFPNLATVDGGELSPCCSNFIPQEMSLPGLRAVCITQ